MGNSGSNGIFLDLSAGRSGLGRYQPGETVNGVAHLNIQTQLNVKGVQLKVSGLETASWKEMSIVANVTRAPRRIVTAAATADPDAILHSQRHEHFKVTVPLMQPTQDGKLEVGQYSIPFSFTLPTNCPPSFSLSGRHWKCAVEYKVKAVCKLVGCKSNLKDTRCFDVMGVMPANLAPLALHDSKTVPRFGFHGNVGQLQMDLNMERNVWFAGDQVQCTGTIANDSKKAVENVHFQVQRLVEIHRGNGHTIQADVVRASFPGVGANERKENVALSINLPSDLVPSCHGRAFNIRYVVSVDCDMSWVKDPKTTAEIVVCAAQGTAPSPLSPPPQPAVLEKWQPEVLPPVVMPVLACVA
eukprot:GGOE01046922.1.p1 GENE.GGOE01046922.1~~GGOE01046922.1.p1  ORF type:complete len:369 (+),score=110.15 GGOE01046922.1:37-1107(+)